MRQRGLPPRSPPLRLPAREARRRPGLREVCAAFPRGRQPGRGWPVGVWPSWTSAAFLPLALDQSPRLVRRADLSPTSSSGLQRIPGPWSVQKSHVAGTGLPRTFLASPLLARASRPHKRAGRGALAPGRSIAGLQGWGRAGAGRGAIVGALRPPSTGPRSAQGLPCPPVGTSPPPECRRRALVLRAGLADPLPLSRLHGGPGLLRPSLCSQPLSSASNSLDLEHHLEAQLSVLPAVALPQALSRALAPQTQSDNTGGFPQRGTQWG